MALLGRGGMGTVWHARDELLDRDVAVKEVLAPPLLSDDEREILCQRTMREARAAARLSHPNVVTIYDVVEEGGCPWIIMELVASRSLAQVVEQDGPLPPQRVAEIGLQVLVALGVAHAAGVLHRDVKPGNVLLREDGGVVLTDFGIATLEGDPSLTRSGMLLGAPAYIAPERVRGHQGGPESDLWSLAATLYTAVEGRPAYDCGAPMPTLTAVLTEPPAPPRLAGPLWPVLEGMLRKDPAERIGAVDAQRGLQSVAFAAKEEQRSTPTAAAPAEAAASVKRVERTRVLPLPQPIQKPDARAHTRDGRRHPLVVAAVAVVVAVVVALFGWGALRSTDGLRTAQPPTAQQPQDQAPAAPPPANETPAAPATPNREAVTERPPSPTPDALDQAAALPSGFYWHHDDTGFSVAVPDEWHVDREGQRVYFREPGGSRFLLIDQTDDPKDDPVADWREQERSRRDGYADYRRIRIAPVDYYRKAADWEFTYAGRDGRVHVLNRGVVTGDDKAYGIYWSTPDRQWSQSLGYFEVFTETFRPAQ